MIGVWSACVSGVCFRFNLSYGIQLARAPNCLELVITCFFLILINKKCYGDGLGAATIVTMRDKVVVEAVVGWILIEMKGKA